MKQLLFLGYSPAQTSLHAVIQGRGWTVHHLAEPVVDLSGFDCVLSYGYRHILRTAALATAKRPPINLHIAYLPFNRGAHPLFWAAYDGTPPGVTIHEIDEGVDTGPICFRRKTEIDYEVETFSGGYAKLLTAMEALFIDCADELLNGTYSALPQTGCGTARKVKDLPEGFAWSDLVGPTVRRLKSNRTD